MPRPYPGQVLCLCKTSLDVQVLCQPFAHSQPGSGQDIRTSFLGEGEWELSWQREQVLCPYLADVRRASGSFPGIFKCLRKHETCAEGSFHGLECPILEPSQKNHGRGCPKGNRDPVKSWTTGKPEATTVPSHNYKQLELLRRIIIGTQLPVFTGK